MIAAIATALVAMLMSLSAQPPSMRITSPAEGAYVTGAVELTVAFEPASLLSSVRQVRWFGDGQQVCTAEKPPFSCEWDAGRAIREHQIRAVALLGDGARMIANARTAGVQVAETVDVDVVQITAVVKDENGRFVSGLTAGDFAIFDEGKPQTLSNFLAEHIPLELVAAVDMSSSMTDALPAVKRLAIDFLAQLQPTDQVTVLGFNDNIFTLARRSTDQDVRAKAIDRLAPWGGTALYDVMHRALDLLGRQTGRRAIVLFTDGDDQSSHASVKGVLERAESSDATIYMIGQGRALEASDLQQLMRQLAAVSGGRAFFSGQEAKLDTIFQEILEDLRHQYLLTYVPPEQARNGEWRRLRVEVRGHDYAVRTRQGYRIARAHSE
jgi:Ca-activated chloride channel homolog